MDILGFFILSFRVTPVECQRNTRISLVLIKTLLRLIKAWVKNDFRLQCPPSKVRGIRVDCASNHSYLESRSRSSWTASAILKCRLCIGFSHLRWWIRQFRGRHQKKVITFSLLSSFPQKMAWYRYLKAKENPFEPTKTSKHRSQHVHWFHCKYNATWIYNIALISRAQ